MEYDRTVTSRSGERPVTRWRREQESSEKSPVFSERPTSGVSRPYSKMERPTSRRGIKTDITEYGISRPPTSGKNALSRPPSATFLSNRVSTPGSRINTMSSANLSRINSGLPRNFIQSSAMILDRPITQQGLAGVSSGLSRGIPRLSRQTQDKRYYEQLLQLKIRELKQEIATIGNEVKKQNKERPTYMHYDQRAKDLAAELTELQNQLADYNTVLDKMTSGADKEQIQQEARELKELNDREEAQLEHIFQKRQQAEKKLNDLNKEIEFKQKVAEEVVENMEPEIRRKYEDALTEKIELQKEIDGLQVEYDQVTAEKSKLEEKIAFSPIKQEAYKLYTKIFEAEQKREKLLEQLETDVDKDQLGTHGKDDELRKRDEIMENFTSTFEKNNKAKELEKLSILEEQIVERLEQISENINGNVDSSILMADEMEMLKTLMDQNFESNSEKSFEELKQENMRLEQIASKLDALESKIKIKLNNVKENPEMLQNQTDSIDNSEVYEEIDVEKQKELLASQKELFNQQKNINDELEVTKRDYSKLKEDIQENEIYRSISILEEKLEKVGFQNEQFEHSAKGQLEQADNSSLMEKLMSLTAQYNAILINDIKSLY